MISPLVRLSAALLAAVFVAGARASASPSLSRWRARSRRTCASTAARLGVSVLRARDPARLVVAVPAAAPEACEALDAVADETVCAMTPEPFYAVGNWYESFQQTGDDEMRALLERAVRERRSAA